EDVVAEPAGCDRGRHGWGDGIPASRAKGTDIGHLRATLGATESQQTSPEVPARYSAGIAVFSRADINRNRRAKQTVPDA
ncbi:MAG TPA: hypothetical protein VJK29_07835, partial [Terriglobales bacterium]|nr:hypothetical protein [Terriglobales bacterium]